MDVVSDRRFEFDAVPERFWAAIGSVEDYPLWWPWVRRLDAKGLIAGDVWQCTVKPPLPYVVRFAIHLDHVAPDQEIRARVSGDIVGTAELDVAPSEGGCIVHLRSRLTPAKAALRLAAALGRPLARYGHDWVLDVGAGQFAARAL